MAMASDADAENSQSASSHWLHRLPSRTRVVFQDEECGVEGSGSITMRGSASQASSRFSHPALTLPIQNSRSGLPGVGPVSLKATGVQSAETIISHVKNMRKSSVIQVSTNCNAPPMNAKFGSLAVSFYAPNQQPSRALSFSPDGKLLIRYGFGNDVRVLHTSTGAIATTLAASNSPVRYAAFSHDSLYLLAATDDCKVVVWSTTAALAGAKATVGTIDVGLEPVAFCTLSPDAATVLSCDDDGQLETWSVARGVMIRRYDVPPAKVCAFGPGGSFIVCCSRDECSAALLDVESGQVLHSDLMEDIAESRNHCQYCVTADGHKVAAWVTEPTSGPNLVVLDTITHERLALRACSGAVVHAGLSSHGSQLICSGRDDMIHVLNTSTGDILCTLEGHASDVLYCSLSSDGKQAISGDNDGCVMVWDLEAGQSMLRLQAHTVPLAACDLSHDATRGFSVDHEGRAFLWLLDTQHLFEIMRLFSVELCCAYLAQQGDQLAVGYSDGSVRLWDTALVDTLWVHNRHEGPVTSVLLSHGGKQLASGGRNGKVLLTDAATGAALASIQACTGVVVDMCYSADDRSLLVAGRDGTLSVFPTSGTTDKALVYVVMPEDAEVVRACFCPHDKLMAAASVDGKAYVYDARRGDLLHSLSISDVPVSHVSFSEDSARLVAGAQDGAVSVLELSTGALVQKLVGNASGVNEVYFEGRGGKDMVISVCSRQAVKWDAGEAKKMHAADFICDFTGLFENNTMPGRMFVAHDGLVLYDSSLEIAAYDMRAYEKHPGNSYLLRNSTVLMRCGELQSGLVMFCPPDETVHMLVNELGGVKALDFSSDGHMLVSGNHRGELAVWDAAHRQQLHHWVAHKRFTITCVKFSHDSSAVYSCAEDCKVIVWDWRNQSQMAQLTGHQAPVVSVEMDISGRIMASGDKDGIIIIWDAETHTARQVIPAHESAILCCSISPDGSKVASSGADEHIVILDTQTGQQLYCLDEALDGKGLTIKFSFDGTRVEVGGEKGNILVWSLESDCLMFDIDAHQGKVYDCSWSGDSRRLLSVGSDGRARLWDAAAGSELCAANFERGFGSGVNMVESGGFIKCDLSVTGSYMAGCTAKGQLVMWDVVAELRRAPEGSMLYQWMASMPLSKARDIYSRLLLDFPLLLNAQDSRGWTMLMHAANDSNPEVTKLIVARVEQRSSRLGLVSSPIQNAPGLHPAASSHRGEVPAAAAGAGPGSMRKSGSLFGNGSQQSSRLFWRPGGSGTGSSNLARVAPEPVHAASHVAAMPNAVKIALEANSADCVQHLLDAVLAEKVTQGSYAAITHAIPDVAAQYPSMCQAFLTGLPLRSLGDMEVPAALVKGRDMVVKSSNSYTSYKEFWNNALQLSKAQKGPMLVMSASMVQLPFAGSIGKGSLLHTLVESNVPVRTFGSETIKAIISYKWNKFAQTKIYIKAVVYFTFTMLFTIFAILYSDDEPADDLTQVMSTHMGRATLIMAVVLFFFGAYYQGMEFYQMFKLGLAAYFDSFWNFVDIVSYCATLIIMPCYVFRYGMDSGGFVPVLIALEVIMLWIKVLFFLLAIDGVGTFIYMTIEIITGMRYFLLLLFTLFISFGVSFMVLFRKAPDDYTGDGQIYDHYRDVGQALLSSFVVVFGNEDPRQALGTEWSQVATIVLCVYNFMLIVILLNMLITLMADIYAAVKANQAYVFLQGRAELIIEVESTMNSLDHTRYSKTIHPYLHILTYHDSDEASQAAKPEDAPSLDTLVNAVLARLEADRKEQAAGGAGGGSGGPGNPSMPGNPREPRKSDAGALLFGDDGLGGGGLEDLGLAGPRGSGLLSSAPSFARAKSMRLTRQSTLAIDRAGSGGLVLPPAAPQVSGDPAVMHMLGSLSQSVEAIVSALRAMPGMAGALPAPSVTLSPWPSGGLNGPMSPSRQSTSRSLTGQVQGQALRARTSLNSSIGGPGGGRHATIVTGTGAPSLPQQQHSPGGKEQQDEQPQQSNPRSPPHGSRVSINETPLPAPRLMAARVSIGEAPPVSALAPSRPGSRPGSRPTSRPSSAQPSDQSKPMTAPAAMGSLAAPGPGLGLGLGVSAAAAAPSMAAELLQAEISMGSVGTAAPAVPPRPLPGQLQEEDE